MAEGGGRAKSRSLSREDWIVSAMDALVRDGADAIRIDRLCDGLEVTKGSFYHHFASRDALVEAMGAYWSKTQPEQVFGVLGDVTDAPMRKLKQLIQLSTDLDIGTRDHAMRAFGASEPTIARAVDAADKRVMATLETIFLGFGASPADAGAFARLLMFATIGFYTAPNLVTKAESRDLGRRLIALMTAQFQLDAPTSDARGEDAPRTRSRARRPAAG